MNAQTSPQQVLPTVFNSAQLYLLDACSEMIINHNITHYTLLNIQKALRFNAQGFFYVCGLSFTVGIRTSRRCKEEVRLRISSVPS